MKLSLLILLVVTTSISCKKFLDEKPDKKLAIPATLNDLQSILDNNYQMNYGSGTIITASDEYYLTLANWNALSSAQDKDIYIWKDNFELNAEWNRLYRIAYLANTVMDNLEKVGSSESPALYNNILGSALFYRSHAFYHLSQAFAPPYKEQSASTDLGIPLRLNADFLQPSVRSSLRQTYDQVIHDLQSSLQYLPNVPKNKLRPSRPAAFGLLARVYLIMEDYQKAKQYADSCLTMYPTLIDFNSLNPSSAIPLGAFNQEVLFHSLAGYSQAITSGIARVDTLLYQSYATNDLRKAICFTGSNPAYFKGNYYSNLFDIFNGIATDEIYLIRAEANARLGFTTEAMTDLNTLLQKRWRTGFFTPIAASTPAEALIKILEERKKELLFRGLRWPDLRRLNKDARFAQTISRVLGQDTYLLPQNDKRYTFLIPTQVINLTGMAQNPR